MISDQLPKWLVHLTDLILKIKIPQSILSSIGAPSPFLFAVVGCAAGVIPLCLIQKVNQGLGYDGVKYAGWAKDFHRMVFEQRLDFYFAHRILPSAIIHYGFRLLNIPLIDLNIGRAFALVNIFSLSLLGYLWGHLSRDLRFSPQQMWLGACMFFLNTPVLVWAPMIPVQHDILAYVIGTLLIYFHVSENPIGLCVTAIVSFFTWPTGIVLGAILFIFPRKMKDANRDRPLKYPINIVLCAFAIVVVVAIFNKYRTIDAFSLALDPLKQWYWVSLGITVLYIYFAGAPLLAYDSLYDLREWNKYGVFRRLLEVGASMTLITIVERTFLFPMVGEQKRFPIFGMVLSLPGKLVMTSVAQPGVFLVAHIVYFGPWVILAIVHWKSVCRQIHSLGVGITVCACFSLVFSIFSESRCWMNFVAFWIPAVVAATADGNRKAPSFWKFAFLSLAFINLIFLNPEYAPFHGPWMHSETYVPNAIAALFGFFFLALSGS